jgi:hypothetical protein
MTEETKPQTEEPKTEETQTEEQQTEEPEKEPTQIEEVTKLLIDKPSDFKFHAAYLAYSKTWDKIASPNTRTELNDMLLSLSKEEMDYSSFYRALDDYRRRGSKHYEFSRERIETQRKRDWRKKQTRSQRNQRHKGKH